MSVPVRMTYQAVDEVPMQGSGSNTVALATGETIDLSLILANEAKRPETLLVHRVEGVYVLVGEGFKNLYVMYPSKDTTAGVDPVPLSSAAVEPKLRPGVASRCTLLTYKTAQGAEQKLYIGSGGQTSPSNCPDKETSGT